MGQREDIVKELKRRKVIAELQRRKADAAYPTPDIPGQFKGTGQALQEAGGATIGRAGMGQAIQEEAASRPIGGQITAGLGASGMKTLQGARQLGASVGLGEGPSEEDVKEWRALGGATAATKGGEIAGDVMQWALPGKAIEGAAAAAKGIPMAARLAGSGALAGGLAGGLQPVIGGESRGTNIATGLGMGAAAGGALGAAGTVVNRLAQPVVPKDAAVKMMNAGVQPTLGQGAKNSLFGHVENLFRLMTGANQQRARLEAGEELAVRMANVFDDRPIDWKDMDKAFEMLQKHSDEAYDAVFDAAEAAGQTARKGGIGNALGTAMKKKRPSVIISDGKVKRGEKWLQDRLDGLGDRVSLREFHALRSDIREQGFNYAKSTNPENKALGNMFNAVEQRLTESAKGWFPDAMDEVARVDYKYGLQKIFERAKTTGNKQVTPEAINNAVHALTANRRVLARGGARVQAELKEIDELMPPPPPGGWGGLILGQPAKVALPGIVGASSRVGAKAAFGRYRGQKALGRGAKAFGRGTQGVTTALAGAMGAQGSIHDNEE